VGRTIAPDVGEADAGALEFLGVVQALEDAESLSAYCMSKPPVVRDGIPIPHCVFASRDFDFRRAGAGRE